MKRIHLLALATLVLASCSKPLPPRTEAFSKLPYWPGIWIFEPSFDVGISGFSDNRNGPRVLMDPASPWNEVGRQRMKDMALVQGTRKAPGWGYPMMMTSASPLQFLITPEETLIINMYQETRHVYTDGRDHPKAEDRWPTTWGDSVGHWEGDTLVIDTVSVREPNKYFQMTPPLTDDAHYTERLRMTAPDRIEIEFTIEDPAVLSAPLVAKTAYKRSPNLDRLMHDAFENDRSEVDGNTFTIAPPQP